MKMLRWEYQQEDVMCIGSTRMGLGLMYHHLTVSSSTSYFHPVYGGIGYYFIQKYVFGVNSNALYIVMGISGE